MNANRLSMLALLISAALAVGILLAATSVRTHDLEQLHEIDEARQQELAVLHHAICDLRTGYNERQELFGMFLSRPFPGGPTRQLVVALKGSFEETLYALRDLNCNLDLGAHDG